MYPSVCIGPQVGEVLDDVMRRVGPSMVLELGMHCAYSSVRLLRLLPPGGRLITVEIDPFTADLGEEIILVAGFKDQFQVLPLSSGEAILSLRELLAPQKGGFSLVLMDHDPVLYLKDLLSLEAEGLLCPIGCSIILIHRDRRADSVKNILDYIRTKAQCYQIKTEIQIMTEICYKSAGTMVE
ncbi:transmembrane O-methyltransferase homolog isoform X2 [Sphaeramia orbicularis]|nr:transmembrane O-methyltransferase homolog isoform X2 [Sphaeramia orbicularis]